MKEIMGGSPTQRRINTNSEYKFGLNGELACSELICNQFNVKKNVSRWAVFDFESDEYLVELKTRRCKSTQYKDVMMNKPKIDKARKTNKKVIFVFNFLDGIFYWEYDKNVDLRNDLNGRLDRGCYEEQIMYYIPIDIMQKLQGSAPARDSI
jgi:hypothetical protein